MAVNNRESSSIASSAPRTSSIAPHAPVTGFFLDRIKSSFLGYEQGLAAWHCIFICVQTAGNRLTGNRVYLQFTSL